jgi:hypothetical protein
MRRAKTVRASTLRVVERTKLASRMEFPSRGRHVVLLLTMLAGVPLLVGCGDASHAEGVSTAQYVSQGQAICRDVQERLDVLGKKLRTKSKPAPAAVGRGARKSAQAVRAGVRRLALVPVPSQLSAPSSRLSRTLIHQARALEKLATAVDTAAATHDPRPIRRKVSRLRQSEARAAAAARKTGLTACGD